MKNAILFSNKLDTMVGKYIALNEAVRMKEVVIKPEMEVLARTIDRLNEFKLPVDRDDFKVETPDGEFVKVSEIANSIPKSMVCLVAPMNVSVTGDEGVYQMNFKDSDVEPSTNYLLSFPYNLDRIIDAGKKLCKWAGKPYSAGGYKISASLAEVNELVGMSVPTADDDEDTTIDFCNVRCKGSIPVTLTLGDNLYDDSEYNISVSRCVTDLLNTAMTFI